MNLEQARKFIEEHEWVFAKTYADTFPHEYTVRKKAKDDKTFNRFIEFMRDNSKIKSFFKKEYLYCEIDGIEYWEMGRPILNTEVINRAPINDEADYRFPPPPKENWQKLYDALAEREKRIQDLLSKEKNNEITDEELSELKKHFTYFDNKIDSSRKSMSSYLQENN